jgi:hypothetical protein
MFLLVPIYHNSLLRGGYYRHRTHGTHQITTTFDAVIPQAELVSYCHCGPSLFCFSLWPSLFCLGSVISVLCEIATQNK